jgi:hypothetical protein
MNPEIQQLRQMIDDLKKEIDALKSNSTIPLDVQRALSSRGFVFSDNYNGAIDEAIYVQTNNLSGSAETIFTFGLPTQWLEIEGTEFVIPIYKKFN